MSTRSTIRRMALVCAGALAIVPLTAGAASAQSAEELCEQSPGDPLTEALCDAFADDGDGDDGDGPLDALDPDELCALQDDAPEQLAPLLDALAPLIDEICDAEEEEEPGEPQEPEEPEEPQEPQEPQEPEEAADTADADPSGELPRTGGLAGLAGLGLLGAGVALRRLRSAGDLA